MQTTAQKRSVSASPGFVLYVESLALANLTPHSCSLKQFFKLIPSASPTLLFTLELDYQAHCLTRDTVSRLQRINLHARDTVGRLSRKTGVIIEGAWPSEGTNSRVNANHRASGDRLPPLHSRTLPSVYCTGGLQFCSTTDSSFAPLKLIESNWYQFETWRERTEEKSEKSGVSRSGQEPGELVDFLMVTCMRPLFLPL